MQEAAGEKKEAVFSFATQLLFLEAKYCQIHIQLQAVRQNVY